MSVQKIPNLTSDFPTRVFPSHQNTALFLDRFLARPTHLVPSDEVPLGIFREGSLPADLHDYIRGLSTIQPCLNFLPSRFANISLKERHIPYPVPKQITLATNGIGSGRSRKVIWVAKSVAGIRMASKNATLKSNIRGFAIARPAQSPEKLPIQIGQPDFSQATNAIPIMNEVKERAINFPECNCTNLSMLTPVAVRILPIRNPSRRTGISTIPTRQPSPAEATANIHPSASASKIVSSRKSP